MSEVLVILLAALILFGPNRLPEMGKSLGKAIREFRRATSDLGRELEEARDEIEQAAKPPVSGKPPGNATASGSDDASPEEGAGERPKTEQEHPPE